MTYKFSEAPTKAIPDIRSYDGGGNNKANPNWGKANEPLLRLTKPSYADGCSKPPAGRPNPRTISNIVCVSENRPPHRKLSNFMWAWGQYLDHEIDLSPEQEPPEHLNMKAPANDPDSPNAIIEFNRSIYAQGTGSKKGGKSNPRQQINVLPAYIDAANVYGVNEKRALGIRALDGTGKLKVTPSKNGDLLPLNVQGLLNVQGPLRKDDPPEHFFIAGDVRANEHNVLTCMHTLFVREHNSICDELAKNKTPALKKEIAILGRDEALYQRARRIVGALEQVITYEEFLPALLGRGAIPRYRGYKKNVNAGIANVFSTAVYRLGHDMLNETILLAPIGKQQKAKSVGLHELFFKPEQVKKLGIEVFLNGLAKQNMQQVDGQTAAAIRTHLFNVDTRTRGRLLDLAALNIQRGRDHGLPDYNQCRADFGLKRKRTFEEITTDPVMLARLKKAYKSIDKIDPWVGGLCEKPYRKALVGELFYTVLRDQFLRLRDGDRFWYQNDPAFSKLEVVKLKRTKLSDIIKRNTKIMYLQDNVFFI